MTLLKISSLAVITIAIAAACNSTKKSTSSTASTTPASTSTTPTSTVAASPAKPATGILPPTDEQLTAIKISYPDATLPVLTEGYNLYVGVCTDCHGAKSIYRIPTDKWMPIINNMAKRSKLTDPQKDALTKYVFSVKATQPAPAGK